MDELGTAALDVSGKKGAKIGSTNNNFNASGVNEGKPTTDNPAEVIKPTGTQNQHILPDYQAQSGIRATEEGYRSALKLVTETPGSDKPH